MQKFFYPLLIILFFTITGKSNNVVISGVATSGQSVTFNISWSNSWNASTAPSNYDAVWVFIKYQDCTSPTIWRHAIIDTGSTVGSPLQLDNVSDSLGVFLRRSAAGTGNISSTAVTIKVTIPIGTYNIKVFGIEMVYAPSGDFLIGDNSTSTNTFVNSNITAALQSSGISAGTIGTTAVSGSGFANVALPSTFPMGQSGFYCMKYEVSQQQYVEFLNTISYNQQAGCTFLAPNVSPLNYSMHGSSSADGRNGISTSTVGVDSTTPAIYTNNCNVALPHNSTDDGQWNACNYLSWSDLSAYLDWAALRPLTELEYEKICRGFNGRVSGEFVWGNNSTSQNSIYIGMTGTYNSASITPSTVSNGPYQSYGYGVCQGVLRCGYAATATSTRVTAGAAYFGAMEMCGNVWEQVVNTTTTQGAAYTGLHGDGYLTNTGSANVSNWPNPSTGLGTGRKGGSCDVVSGGNIQLSARNGINTPTTTRYCGSGGRGGRTF